MTSETKIYDVEFVVPVCSKYMDRIDDFKKYGLVNIKDRRVLLTLILSAEQIEGLKEGWPEGVVPNAVENERPNFVSNVYRYFLDSPKRSRWIVKMDDDSCTDVDGLLANLDEFYEWEEPCYLANCPHTYKGPEASLSDLYKKHIGNNFVFLSNEIECSIFTNVTLNKIRENERSYKFLKERSDMTGGVTDVAMAHACFLAKIPVARFPFSSNLPLVQDFSLVGSHLNHIHLIKRNKFGENNSDSKELNFFFLTKIVDKKMTEIENNMVGKKILIESEVEMFLVKFNSDYTATLKPRSRRVLWMEHEGTLMIFFEPDKPWILIKKENEGVLKASFYGAKEKLNLTVLA